MDAAWLHDNWAKWSRGFEAPSSIVCYRRKKYFSGKWTHSAPLNCRLSVLSKGESFLLRVLSLRICYHHIKSRTVIAAYCSHNPPSFNLHSDECWNGSKSNQWHRTSYDRCWSVKIILLHVITDELTDITILYTELREGCSITFEIDQ